MHNYARKIEYIQKSTNKKVAFAVGYDAQIERTRTDPRNGDRDREKVAVLLSRYHTTKRLRIVPREKRMRKNTR